MKAARVLLLLSPIIIFLPPLLPSWNKSVAWGLLGFLFRRILRSFPWNCLMGGLCYSYAKQLGRDEWRWGMGGLIVPFLTPCILAFMPPKPYSTAADFRVKRDAPPPKSVAGSFEDRFPLLERCLSTQPEEIRSEQKARFTAIPVNFEFLMTVAPEALEKVVAEMQLRKLTPWVELGEKSAQLFGAGLVPADRREEATAWLLQVRVPGTKVDVSARDPDGRLRHFEYRSA